VLDVTSARIFLRRLCSCAAVPLAFVSAAGGGACPRLRPAEWGCWPAAVPAHMAALAQLQERTLLPATSRPIDSSRPNPTHVRVVCRCASSKAQERERTVDVCVT
jgi:hypothetical protein